MDTNQYKVIITPTAYREINKIYDYITEELYAKNAANDLMEKVEEEVQRLKYAPKIHTEIEKIDELKRNYRRIVIKNYIILYTIDEEKNVVFISHMYYGGRNYIDNNLL
ncbi:MAG: type II toxin-antitoxin system RelE/ParE family toxin [Clostridia bacterium]